MAPAPTLWPVKRMTISAGGPWCWPLGGRDVGGADALRGSGDPPHRFVIKSEWESPECFETDRGTFSGERRRGRRHPKPLPYRGSRRFRPEWIFRTRLDIRPASFRREAPGPPGIARRHRRRNAVARMRTQARSGSRPIPNERVLAIDTPTTWPLFLSHSRLRCAGWRNMVNVALIQADVSHGTAMACRRVKVNISAVASFRNPNCPIRLSDERG